MLLSKLGKLLFSYLDDEEQKTWDQDDMLLALKFALGAILDVEDITTFSAFSHLVELKLKPGCVQDFCDQGVDMFFEFPEGADGYCGDPPDDENEQSKVEKNLDDMLRDWEPVMDCDNSTGSGCRGDDCPADNYRMVRYRRLDGSRCIVRVEPAVPDDGKQHTIKALVYTAPDFQDIGSVGAYDIPDDQVHLVLSRALFWLFSKDTDDTYTDPRIDRFLKAFEADMARHTGAEAIFERKVAAQAAAVAPAATPGGQSGG